MSKIDRKLLKRKYNSANLAKEKLDILCNDMSKIIQPLYDKEIFVFYQESDGFVVVYDSDNFKEVPFNLPVSEHF